jgi:hypothetical protein
VSGLRAAPAASSRSTPWSAWATRSVGRWPSVSSSIPSCFEAPCSPARPCFANEIGDVCAALGADAQEAMRIFLMDEAERALAAAGLHHAVVDLTRGAIRQRSAAGSGDGSHLQRGSARPSRVAVLPAATPRRCRAGVSDCRRYCRARVRGGRAPLDRRDILSSPPPTRRRTAPRPADICTRRTARRARRGRGRAPASRHCGRTARRRRGRDRARRECGPLGPVSAPSFRCAILAGCRYARMIVRRAWPAGRLDGSRIC